MQLRVLRVSPAGTAPSPSIAAEVQHRCKLPSCLSSMDWSANISGQLEVGERRMKDAEQEGYVVQLECFIHKPRPN